MPSSLNRKQRRAAASRARHAKPIKASAPAKPRGSISLSAPLTIRASADGQAPPRFDMLAWSGEPLLLWNFDFPVVLDLTGLQSSQQIPLLYEHCPDTDRVLGQSDSVTVSGGQILAAGIVTVKDDPALPDKDLTDAQRILRLSRNGQAWQASVGAIPERADFVPKGTATKVNGRSYEGPIYVARGRIILREITVCSLGADGKTSTLIRGSNMPPTFSEWMLANGFVEGDLDEMQIANLKRLYRIEFPNADPDNPDSNTPAPSADDPPVNATGRNPLPIQASGHQPTHTPAPNVDPVVAYRRRIVAEDERIDGIRQICASFNNPSIEVEENGQKRTVNLQIHATANGWDVTRTRLEARVASRPNPEPISNNTGPEVAKIVEAALCISAGLDPKKLEKKGWFDQKTIDAAVSKEYRSESIASLSGRVIQAAGRHVRPGKITDDFIREALISQRIIQASGFTSVSLTMLANVANKALISAYDAVEVTWPLFCAVRSHSDFKTVTRYRLDSTGAFKKVGPDGELKHIGLTNASYTNQLATFGAIVALTRQMWLNDDLGGFAELPGMLGRLGALRIEEAVYTLLLANTGSFFHADNRNLATGGSSALGIDSLTALKQKFQDQVDSNGKPILSTPKVALAGTALGETLRLLANEAAIIAGTSTAKQPAKNPHAGTVTPVVSPYVSNTSIKDQDGAAITGQSSTLWYLFADPAVRAAIGVAFLNGQRMPIIESSDTEFDTLGLQWRAYSDFGVGFEDPTAAARADGA